MTSSSGSRGRDTGIGWYELTPRSVAQIFAAAIVFIKIHIGTVSGLERNTRNRPIQIRQPWGQSVPTRLSVKLHVASHGNWDAGKNASTYQVIEIRETGQICWRIPEHTDASRLDFEPVPRTRKQV